MTVQWRWNDLGETIYSFKTRYPDGLLAILRARGAEAWLV